VEGYAEMKNVFKNAPEITFWGGNRFYDRYNIDSEDYYWLNTSGFGVGVYNIHLGPGTLWLAWLGNNNDNINEATGFNGTNGVSLFNSSHKSRQVVVGATSITIVVTPVRMRSDKVETWARSRLRQRSSPKVDSSP